MPVTPSYPGVYIEEVPSSVRTIVGVATSVAAFIGFFRRGPMDRAVQIFSMGDFEREFGGLDARSEASYAVQQFFLNGGTEAWVVRVASGSVPASVTIGSAIDGAAAITVEAIDDGSWGNALRILVDHDVPVAGEFNLTVSEYVTRRGRPAVARQEVFRNLSMNSGHTNFVDTVINDENTGSKMVRVAASGTDLPLVNGTLSGVLSPFPALSDDEPVIDVTIGSQGPFPARFASKPGSLSAARTALESAIRSANHDPAFLSATVRVAGDRLHILAGPAEPESRVVFSQSTSADPALAELGLDSVTQVQGVLSGDLSTFAGLTNDPASVEATIGAVPSVTVSITGSPADLDAARTALEAGIQAADGDPTFANARVLRVGDQLLVLPGTVGDPISFAQSGSDPAFTELGLDTLTLVEGPLSADLSGYAGLTRDPASIQATIGAVADVPVAIAGSPADLDAARTALEAGIQAADGDPTFANARVVRVDDRLLVLPGTDGDAVLFEATPDDTHTLQELRLDEISGATLNAQEYALGEGVWPLTAQLDGMAGNDGDEPDGAALRGDRANKTGLYALEDVDLFNILCIPRLAMVTGANPLTETEALAVMAEANTYCHERRAFFVVDTPSNRDDVQEIRDWLSANAAAVPENAALYFPRLQIADPLNDFRLRSVGASGTIAGLYARTDSERGVWKAPAGTDAILRGVQAFDYKLNDLENGALNPLAINCLRSFPVYGKVCWGARTLDGADQRASEWKYVPVRRLALFLEESLYRGTQWVVFEPNDEPLWAQIRLNVGAFMHNLFRQGAFQGTTPREAYFVKCDKETTTQNDINQGIVNILVGFAPLKPAEFVIIKISQIAGQIQT